MRLHSRTSTLDIGLSFLVCAVVCFHNAASSESSVSSHNTITTCDGETATFSWPCDLAYDLVKVMNLTFRGHSSMEQVVASIDGSGRVSVSAEYSNRVKTRGTTGIHLEHVGILDSGAFLTRATFANGTVLDREFVLKVQVPPLLKENQLKVAQHSDSGNCHSLTCGTVLFPGFPALVFRWQTPQGIQSGVLSDGVSTLHGCPLSVGNYSCQVMGPAVACAKQKRVRAFSAVTSVELSAKTVKELAAREAEEEARELILKITVPIVVVLTPLIILGVWLMCHLLSGTSYCGGEDSEEGLSSASSPSGMHPSPSSAPLIPHPSPDLDLPPLSSAEEKEGEGGGGEEEEEEKDTDEDLGNLTEPLLDPEFSVPIDLDADDDDRETKL